MNEAKPILLLTRPRRQADRFAELCRNRFGSDLRIVTSPVLRISMRTDAVDLAGVAALILTSGNAVPAIPPTAAKAGMTAYAVGDSTAMAARMAGLQAVSAGGTSDDLVAMLLKLRPDGRLLHLHGAETRGSVVDRLADAGIQARGQTVYEQKPVPLSKAALAALAGDNPVALPVFSPRSAELLSVAARNAAAPLTLVTLSAAVAEAWTGPEPQAWIPADHANEKSMCDALARIFSDGAP